MRKQVTYEQLDAKTKQYLVTLREQIADALGVAPEDVQGSVLARLKDAEKAGAPVYWGMIPQAVQSMRFPR